MTTRHDAALAPWAGISFELDGVGTVLLPSIPHMLFDPKQARKSIEKDGNVRMPNAASRHQQ
jgi:hypothetical protein